MGLRKTRTEMDDDGKIVTYEPGKIKTGTHVVGPVTLAKDIASVLRKRNTSLK